jgi:hypothetical protein
MGARVPLEFKDRLGKSVRGDFYWIDVLLRDGRVLKGLTSDGNEILGTWDGMGGGSPDCAPSFTEGEIRRIRPHSWFPFREQLLPFMGKSK